VCKRRLEPRRRVGQQIRPAVESVAIQGADRSVGGEAAEVPIAIGGELDPIGGACSTLEHDLDARRGRRPHPEVNTASEDDIGAHRQAPRRGRRSVSADDALDLCHGCCECKGVASQSVCTRAPRHPTSGMQVRTSREQFHV